MNAPAPVSLRLQKVTITQCEPPTGEPVARVVYASAVGRVAVHKCNGRWNVFHRPSGHVFFRGEMGHRTAIAAARELHALEDDSWDFGAPGVTVTAMPAAFVARVKPVQRKWQAIIDRTAREVAALLSRRGAA